MTTLTLFYTYRLRGNLDLLPRLYTFLQTLRRGCRAPDTLCLLVDLGESCAPDVWPCSITEGRSTLIALDAMGYHAANVSGVLTHASRDKLLEQVSLALVDADHPHLHENVLLTTDESPLNDSPALTVSLTHAESTTLHNRLLKLAQIEGGQVGEVRLSLDSLTLEHTALHTLPTTTSADSTIAGVVEYIRGEARYFEKKKAQSSGQDQV